MLRWCLPSAATPVRRFASPQRDALPLSPDEHGGAEAIGEAAVADELAEVGDEVLVAQPPAQVRPLGLAYSCSRGLHRDCSCGRDSPALGPQHEEQAAQSLD